MFYAIPIFIIICGIASFSHELGLTRQISHLMGPFFKLIGIPKDASLGIILSIIRKDAGILFLRDSGVTGLQLMLAAFLGSTFTPCLVTAATFFKELPKKIAAQILVIQVIFAIIATFTLSLMIDFYRLL